MIGLVHQAQWKRPVSVYYQLSRREIDATQTHPQHALGHALSRPGKRGPLDHERTPCGTRVRSGALLIPTREDHRRSVPRAVPPASHPGSRVRRARQQTRRHRSAQEGSSRTQQGRRHRTLLWLQPHGEVPQHPASVQGIEEMGYLRVRVLNIPNNMHNDWYTKKYRAEPPMMVP
jgi:hypothetical protein